MKKLIMLSAVLLSFITAFAQMEKPIKKVSVEGITEYQLKNGLKVLIFPDPSKATITVNITYLVGSRMEGYGETGMAHLLEHLIFKGSKKHPNIPQELTAHGARPNGTTWYDRTNYFETFAATEENLRWALDLESDRMLNSFIAKKDLETEFSVVRNEFEMGENYPSAVLEERVMSTAYLWHNYGKSTIGSKEDIEKVPIENLQAFYRKYYQPDNAVLTIAGKVDEAKTIELVNEYFGKLPKPSRVLQEPYTVEPVQDGERSVMLRRVGDVQVVSCGYHVPSGYHPDFAAIRVLSHILSNEPGGRLYKAMVEKKKASTLYSYAYALKDPGYLYISADVLKEKPVVEAKSVMLNMLDSLKHNPITEEEVERARNKLQKDFDLMYNNSDYVGMTISEYIAQGDWRLWFLSRDNVAGVTAADVNRIVDLYIKPSNRTVGVFIPEQNPDRARIPASPDVASLVKDYKGRAALAAGEAFDPSPSNIDSRTKTGQLAGGARYAMIRKSTRGSSVRVLLTLRMGNKASLSGKSTVANLTAKMLDHGTQSKTRQQIKDEMDRLKSRIFIYNSGQTMNVSIETVKENLIPVLKLSNEILRKPSFPADEFEKLKQEELADIEQNKSEPQAIASNAFERILNPYDKSDFRYVMSFDEQTEAIKNTSLEGIKKFYTDFYNSASATVSVVGDFEEQAVLAELKAGLENWTSAVKYERAPDSHFEIAAKQEKINTPDKANAMMMAGINLELRDDDPDYAALMIGNYMLGGGFLNSRLATRIRQKEGISYGVGSWVQADPLDKTGGFGSYAIYNPDNADRLIEAYKQELERMLKEGFTQEELKDAKSGFLQGQNVSRSQDNYLTNKLNSNLFLNRTMKWNEELEKRISTLTVEDVNAAMRRWIKPEKLTFIQAGDFNKP